MDRHDLYERCVQSPAELVRLLGELHGGTPRDLREDFAGTAAVSRAWVAQSTGHRAEAVDLDREALSRSAHAARVRLLPVDVRRAEVHESSCDVVFVGNYSIGEIAAREELVDYLRCSRRRLRSGGVFVCDTYGGESAFRVGTLERRHRGPNGTVLHHVWEQRRVDPLTAQVENALHFRVEDDDCVVEQWPEAFVYGWRLWSVPELVDALRESGFADLRVRTGLQDGHEAPRTDLGKGFSACVVGRAFPSQRIAGA